MKSPEFMNLTLQEEDGIAILTINRPEVLNAMNLEVWHDFTLFADYLEQADHIRVAILTGSGDRSFIAGADINCIVDMQPSNAMQNELFNALIKMENCAKPLIAAINGLAYGGGLEVALACDIRIASENATFGLPELRLGVIPGAGGTQRLSRIVGIGVAKEIILAGRTMTATEAVIHNLIMKTVPQNELMSTAVTLAKSMSKKGPIAMGLAKKAINASMDTDMKTALYIETLSFGLVMGTEDKVEGTTAFVEKRKPNFKGR